MTTTTITREAIMRSGRMAGMVQRYHTWPTVTRQNNADHSWNCLRIYYAVWGRPEGRVLDYLVWHDVGELRTGDLPFPVKQDNPMLKAVIDELEAAQRASLGAPVLHLAPDLKKRVKFCDLAEMLGFGLMEVEVFGNQGCQPVVLSTFAELNKLVLTMDEGDKALAGEYLKTCTF